MSSKKTKNLKRVYVWELPVRIYHWLNALTIVVLIATGFFIADPLVILSGQEASFRYVMGWVRYIHFAAAYVFVFNFIFRLYWGFVGNQYADWKNFIPTNLTFFKRIWSVLLIDIFMVKSEDGGYHAIGHNAMAGFVYFGMFLAFAVQVLTGFGLYADMSTWFFPKLFAWVSPMVGGDTPLRIIHHVATWFFILFTVIHVYLVMYHDYVEGTGEVSSMFGGWKFIEEDVFMEHQEEQQTGDQRASSNLLDIDKKSTESTSSESNQKESV